MSGLAGVLGVGDAEAVVEVTHALDAGALAVIPVDGFYCFVADALDEAAVEALFEAARRPPSDPFGVLVPDLEGARHVATVTPLARELSERFPSGSLGLVLPVKATVPENLVAGRPTVLVRVAPSGFARQLSAHFGPLAVTASLAPGVPAVRSLLQAREHAMGRARWFVDGGALAGERPTIVDATAREPRILRAGSVSAQMLGLPERS